MQPRDRAFELCVCVCGGGGVALFCSCGVYIFMSQYLSVTLYAAQEQRKSSLNRVCFSPFDLRSK